MGVIACDGGDCSITPPISFCGEVGRWKGEGTGGTIDAEVERLSSDGWREADLRYESTAPSQSIGGDCGEPRLGTGGGC